MFDIHTQLLADVLAELRESPTVIFMDTEQVCWRDGDPAKPVNHAREVIQIGAVAVDTQTFAEQAAFEIIVRPTVYPTLSDFCVDLTGVTQDRVETEGIPFPEAWARWVEFVAGRQVLVYRADGRVMRENLDIHRMTNEVPQYRKVRPFLEAIGVPMDGINSGKIARHLGSTNHFREHDALADVRSMAEGFAILARMVDQAAT